MNIFSLIIMLFFIVLLCFLLIPYDSYANEIELIKNTKDYTIHQNCINFDGEWYCYD